VANSNFRRGGLECAETAGRSLMALRGLINSEKPENGHISTTLVAGLGLERIKGTKKRSDGRARVSKSNSFWGRSKKGTVENPERRLDIARPVGGTEGIRAEQGQKESKEKLGPGENATALSRWVRSSGERTRRPEKPGGQSLGQTNPLHP